MRAATTLAALALCGCAQEQPKKAAEAVATTTMETSQKLMKPAGAAAVAGIEAHVEATNQRATEMKEQRLLEREAMKPKAYRWKDKSGQWHISDIPPPEGTAAEVIPLM